MIEKKCAYKYKAKRLNGTFVESIVYALSQEEAFEKICRLGYTPQKIEKTVEEDRRRFERVDQELPLSFNLFGKKQSSQPVHKQYRELKFIGTTRNISVGGMLFSAQKQLAIGTVIDVMLELPSEFPEEQQPVKKKFNFSARVIRCREIEEDKEYEIAVRFLDLPGEARLVLTSYIRDFCEAFDLRYDRRAHRRFRKHISVRYDLSGPKEAEPEEVSEDKRFAGMTKNISAGGLFFSTTKNLAIGTVIDVTLEIPNQEDIQSLAKVVRAQEVVADGSYNIAVFFLNLPIAEQARLNRYVLSLTEQ